MQPHEQHAQQLLDDALAASVQLLADVQRDLISTRPLLEPLCQLIQSWQGQITLKPTEAGTSMIHLHLALPVDTTPDEADDQLLPLLQGSGWTTEMEAHPSHANNWRWWCSHGTTRMAVRYRPAHTMRAAV